MYSARTMKKPHIRLHPDVYDSLHERVGTLYKHGGEASQISITKLVDYLLCRALNEVFNPQDYFDAQSREQR